VVVSTFRLRILGFQTFKNGPATMLLLQFLDKNLPLVATKKNVFAVLLTSIIFDGYKI